MNIKDFFVKILLSFVPSKELRAKIMFKTRYKQVDISRMTELEYYNWCHKEYNIGEHSYISFTTVIKNKQHTKIGKFCQLALGTYLGTSQHPVNLLSTHSIAYSQQRNYKSGGKLLASPQTVVKIPPEDLVKPITVGNDVWIGVNAIVMDGVNIGDGAVIGAGAIVTHDIPPYAIAVGVPARVIKYRFPQNIIDKLLQLKWWDYPDKFIENELPFDNIEKCIEILEKNKHLRQI